MKRSTLFLAAALGGALLADAVLYGAYVDAIRYAGSLAGRLATAEHRQLRPPPFLYEAKPPEFERLVWPAPVDDPAYPEVPDAA